MGVLANPPPGGSSGFGVPSQERGTGAVQEASKSMATRAKIIFMVLDSGFLILVTWHFSLGTRHFFSCVLRLAVLSLRQPHRPLRQLHPQRDPLRIRLCHRATIRCRGDGA